jgi:Kinesin motor domain
MTIVIDCYIERKYAGTQSLQYCYYVQLYSNSILRCDNAISSTALSTLMYCACVQCTAQNSFLELHNEDILDLLSSGPAIDNSNNNSSSNSSNSSSREDGRESLQLRENMQGEVVVTNLSQHEIHSAQELGSLLARGALQRATAR